MSQVLTAPIDLGRSNLPTLADRLGGLLGAASDINNEISAIKTILKGSLPTGSAVEGQLFRATIASGSRLVLDKALVIQFLQEQYGRRMDDQEFQLTFCKPVESVSVRCSAR